MIIRRFVNIVKYINNKSATEKYNCKVTWDGLILKLCQLRPYDVPWTMENIVSLLER